MKDHLFYQHTQQTTTLSIYTLLLSPLFLSTYISTLNTDLADGKTFQNTFLAGPKVHAISAKVHYNSQYPPKTKANPASNLSRGLQMAEQKPQAVLDQAKYETKICQQTVIASTFCPLKVFALSQTEKKKLSCFRSPVVGKFGYFYTSFHNSVCMYEKSRISESYLEMSFSTRLNLDTLFSMKPIISSSLSVRSCCRGYII